MATDTTAAGVSSYVYDAAGNLLIRRDPGQTTLFFGDEQLVLNTATGTITATRYYSIALQSFESSELSCPSIVLADVFGSSARLDMLDPESFSANDLWYATV